ncbi:MAG: type II toxin-antitoxin system PemK/MazF family toxin [Candidatus Anammoxibacter sp.]
MKIDKFHLYLADLNPKFGAEPGKVRPVVVVQTNLLSNVHPSTIVCPITSKVTKEASILRIHLSRKETNLKKSSDILVDQVRSIDNKRFIKHIGELNRKNKIALLDNLKILILE